MRIDAGWQQMIQQIRSAEKTSVEEGKTTAAGATDATGGETPAGTTQVEISGPAMTRQLLKLADKLLSGSALLPSDAPAQLKAQVDMLLKMVMSDFSQLSGGLASFVEEQRSLPQALHRLAEQVNLAQVLATAEETAAKPADAPASNPGQGNADGKAAPTAVPGTASAGNVLADGRSPAQETPVVAAQTGAGSSVGAGNGETATLIIPMKTDNNGLPGEQTAMGLPPFSADSTDAGLQQKQAAQVLQDATTTAAGTAQAKNNATSVNEVPLPASPLGVGGFPVAGEMQDALPVETAVTPAQEQELPVALPNASVTVGADNADLPEQPQAGQGMTQAKQPGGPLPTAFDGPKLVMPMVSDGVMTVQTAATTVGQPSIEPPFSAPVFRQFIAVLVNEADRLLGQDNTAVLMNNAKASENRNTAETLLTSRANVLLHELRQENPAVARFVEKTVASLQQSIVARGESPVQAETQAWKELAFAGSMMQEDSAKLQQWSGAIKEMASTWSRFAQGGAELTAGRDLQMSWMLPFFDSQQGKNRPALIQVYRDKPGSSNGAEKPADTWIRVVSETENAGLVVSSFHQHGDTLDVRINPEAEEGIGVFREMLPELRQRLHELWEESGVDVQ